MVTTTVEPFSSSQVGQVHFAALRASAARKSVRLQPDSPCHQRIGERAARPTSAAQNRSSHLLSAIVHAQPDLTKLAEREGFEPPSAR